MLGFMSKKEYNELMNRFSGLEDRVKWLEENVATKSDINKILEILDGQSKYLDEQDMLIGQVDRHDKWINKIALKTDTKLDY
jgi:hypothetical protein